MARNIEVVDDGSGALRCPDYVDSRVLAAGVAEAIAVPTRATAAGGTQRASHVLINSNADVYARYNSSLAGTAAAVPTDITNGTACELNPAIRFLGSSVAEISLISASACIVTAAFYWS